MLSVLEVFDPLGHVVRYVCAWFRCHDIKCMLYCTMSGLTRRHVFAVQLFPAYKTTAEMSCCQHTSLLPLFSGDMMLQPCQNGPKSSQH